MESNNDSVLCGCKGCRSCIICEKRNTAQMDVMNDRARICCVYCHQLKMVVCKIAQNKNDEFFGFNFDGVTLVDNIISESDENALIKNIDDANWKNSQSGRRKQDFGPKVNFKKKKVKMSTFTGLPHYSLPLNGQLQSLEILSDFQCVEQCNLEYEPNRGSSIDPHFDDSWLWGERLVTISLCSDTFLTMTNSSDEKPILAQLPIEAISKLDKSLLEFLDKHELNLSVDELSGFTLNDLSVKIPMKSRSLLVLKGSARYKWKHAIEREDITARRLCCTFRELSDLFLTGKDKQTGEDLLKIANTFNGQVVL